MGAASHRPIAMQIEPIYADPAILVINKPAGLCCDRAARKGETAGRTCPWRRRCRRGWNGRGCDAWRRRRCINLGGRVWRLRHGSPQILCRAQIRSVARRARKTAGTEQANYCHHETG